jgi:hypothetical protein
VQIRLIALALAKIGSGELRDPVAGMNSKESPGAPAFLIDIVENIQIPHSETKMRCRQ